ncbi:MAG: hypothetical protein KGH98_01515 [Candidatus Micrarchaeota archaeon]|nr:hypothetical protein [Candidatus Micrarchaeota archaeon]
MISWASYFTGREPKTGQLFVLDDVTAFGADRSKVSDIIGALRGRPTVFDAVDLARELGRMIPEGVDAVLLGNGGMVTYRLIVDSGSWFKPPIACLNVRRDYVYMPGQKRPTVSIKIAAGDNGTVSGAYAKRLVLLDDVVASGGTINACRLYLTNNAMVDGPAGFDSASLVASGDLRGIFRSSVGSTIVGINDTYTSQIVRGPSGFPAILSLRFALLRTDDAQKMEYLLKYADSGKIGALKSAIKDIDRESLARAYSKRSLVDEVLK